MPPSALQPALVAGATTLAILGAVAAIKCKCGSHNKHKKKEASEEKKVSPDLVEGFSRERINRLDEWLEQYVDSGKLASSAACITRNDQTVYLGYKGYMNTEEKRPVELDTIYRIYSMTKAVTSVAAMMLWEDGRFQLNEPISNFLPQFKDMKVYVSGTIDEMETVPANKPITFMHLLTHTSGLTYHFFGKTVVDECYRKYNIDFLSSERTSLKDLVDRLAQQPLVSHPGERWNYSVADDVLGYLIEVISGVPLAQFFQQRIFGPLGMVDTFFTVPADKADRLAACYVPSKREGGGVCTVQLDPPSRTNLGMPCGKANYCTDDACLGTHPDKRTKPQELQDRLGQGQFPPSAFLDPLNERVPSGGGGLCSTLLDYTAFASMLANKGELRGARLLAPRTVELMGMNHLPNNQDLEQCGNRIFAETVYDGIGFGLGFAVGLPGVKAGSISTGNLAWGGMASTSFFLDTKVNLAAVFMTQLVPSSTYGELRRNMQTIVYSSLVEE